MVRYEHFSFLTAIGKSRSSTALEDSTDNEVSVSGSWTFNNSRPNEHSGPTTLFSLSNKPEVVALLESFLKLFSISFLLESIITFFPQTFPRYHHSAPTVGSWVYMGTHHMQLKESSLVGYLNLLSPFLFENRKVYSQSGTSILKKIPSFFLSWHIIHIPFFVHLGIPRGCTSQPFHISLLLWNMNKTNA